MKRKIAAGKKGATNPQKRVGKGSNARPLRTIQTAARKDKSGKNRFRRPRTQVAAGRQPKNLTVRGRAAGDRGFVSAQGNRVVQVELKTPLVRLKQDARPRSPFQFTTAAGRNIPRLHEILNRHALAKAHPSFRLRHSGQRRRRTREEKAHLSRFVDLHFPANADVKEVLCELRGLREVEHAIEMRGIMPAAMPVDPLLGTSDQSKMTPGGLYYQWYVFRCGVNRAWPSATGKGVIIADIDAGFRPDHEDLVGNIDPSHAYNAVDGSNNVSAGGNTDHGTGVLGLAGATSNDVGIAGFAYNARLWPIQTDAGNGPPLDGDALANGIDWVVGEDSGGARVVINIELQASDSGANCEQFPPVRAAIQNAISKGFVVCVAAGNGNCDAGTADDGTPIPETGSILVGATAYADEDNPRAAAGPEGSNWGPRVVVSAPGDPNNDVTCSGSSINGYTNIFGGTSGAAAKVAGTIALMLEANPNLTQDEVKSILVETGAPILTDQPIGRFVDAAAAVAAALASKP